MDSKVLLLFYFRCIATLVIFIFFIVLLFLFILFPLLQKLDYPFLFGIQIILARLLTPSEYGLIGVLAIFIAISTVFIDGGFSAALVQYKDRSDRDVSTVFYLNVGLATVIYLLLFFAAP